MLEGRSYLEGICYIGLSGWSWINIRIHKDHHNSPLVDWRRYAIHPPSSSTQVSCTSSPSVDLYFPKIPYGTLRELVEQVFSIVQVI
jgi:hypothetical protein